MYRQWLTRYTLTKACSVTHDSVYSWRCLHFHYTRSDGKVSTTSLTEDFKGIVGISACYSYLNRMRTLPRSASPRCGYAIQLNDLGSRLSKDLCGVRLRDGHGGKEEFRNRQEMSTASSRMLGLQGRIFI